jgi:hypothetical protein
VAVVFVLSLTILDVTGNSLLVAEIGIGLALRGPFAFDRLRLLALKVLLPRFPLRRDEVDLGVGRGHLLIHSERPPPKSGRRSPCELEKGLRCLVPRRSRGCLIDRAILCELAREYP